MAFSAFLFKVKICPHSKKDDFQHDRYAAKKITKHIKVIKQAWDFIRKRM